MFDFIKKILGMPTCRGCIYRRFWGLYCGCKEKGIFPISNWDRNANWCWHYEDRESLWRVFSASKKEEESDGQVGKERIPDS